jgi:hypothetical protein
MTSHQQGTAERLTTAADFFTQTQRALRDATTERDLEAAAKAIDSADFDKLPPGAREDLAALYALKFFQITGALAP